MNDFNGKGYPLEDKRLSLSGTTIAGKQQYRIWRDSQQILVPRGQSITKPESPENVQANTGVFGAISKGYFLPPYVEFRNTETYELFDRYGISTFRDEFPDSEDVTLEDLGIYNLDITLNLKVEFDGNVWNIPKSINLTRTAENVYETFNSHFITTFTPFTNEGNTHYSVEFSAFFLIGKFETHELGTIGFGNHILYMGLQKCSVNSGSSSYLFNPNFNPSVYNNIVFSAQDIQIIRGSR